MDHDIRAIIPVAGEGTRLRPHTFSAPKVLLQVAGKPIIGHILDELKTLGIRRLTLIIGHLGEMIQDYVDSEYDFETTYVQQSEPEGLGHAIWLTREHGAGEKRLLIILGDTVFKADLAHVLAQSDSHIGVKEVADPKRFGIIEMQGEMIRAMVEKPEEPKTNMAIVGIYYLTQPALLYECLDQLIESKKTTKNEYQLTDALQMMLERGARMRPFTLDGWYDCGKAETLLQTNRDMLTHLKSIGDGDEAARYPNCCINPPVSIAPSASIENSIIGPYVTVAQRAVIKNALISDSIISDNATVSNIQLEQSIISDNARVESKAYHLNIGDSSELSLG